MFVLLVRTISLWLSIAVLVGAVGCVQEDDDKATLFDDDHEVPAHAPHSLLDLGQKIRERLAVLESSSEDAVVKAELNDLISWAAEIAADTEIGEERWTPIYELSESIRESIVENADGWTAELRNEALRLCKLTDDACIVFLLSTRWNGF